MTTTLRTLAAAIVLSVPALAGAQVLGTDAPYSGSRSGAASIDAGGNYTSNFGVTWNIAQEGDLLRYTYTFSGYGPPGISHAIVGLSDNCRESLMCVVAGSVRVNGSSTTDYELGDFSGSQPSNPGLASTFYGVKINTPGSVDGVAGITFSFLSDRTPVYGDFYVKGGSSSYAQNDGLLAGNRTSNDVALFIARPDTQGFNVIPEPSTYALMGTGLAGLLVASRRRRGA
jgi:hypothetical protein